MKAYFRHSCHNLENLWAQTLKSNQGELSKWDIFQYSVVFPGLGFVHCPLETRRPKLLVRVGPLAGGRLQGCLAVHDYHILLDLKGANMFYPSINTVVISSYFPGRRPQSPQAVRLFEIMRPLADQRPLFISHVTDVFLARSGYCDNLLLVIHGICCSCGALQHCPRWTAVGPPVRIAICIRNVRKSLRNKGKKWRTHQDLQDLTIMSNVGFFLCSQKTISSNTCTVLTLTQKCRNHDPASSQTERLFFFFPDEYAMQNVLSCNHRMFYFHCSGSNSLHLSQLLWTEQRVCSSVRWAQRKFRRKNK